MNFGVIGAGVVGLTTALELQKEFPNATVSILAEKFGVETTSDVAAGLFRPSPAFTGPSPDITRQWMRDSYEHWDNMHKSLDASLAGVCQISGYIFSRKSPNIVQNHHMEDVVHTYRRATEEELGLCGGRWKYGSYFVTLLSDCSLYLPYALKKDDLLDKDLTRSSGDKPIKLTETQQALQQFWPTVQEEIKKIKQVDAKNQVLPLARIKKIMKLDENAKMIAAEAPLLFAKASEIFIQELTLRAWIHTEDNKRRTLQKNDIAMAIAKCDQFDFLIDIVPREEIKPQKKEADTVKPTTSTDQVQYYLQLAQQHQQALQNTATAGIVNQGIQVATAAPATTSDGSMTLATPQGILLTTPNANTATAAGSPIVVNNIQNQQIQILQQMVQPTTELTHMPITITQNQLNLLRLHMQGNTGNANQPQQLVIPAMQAQQQQASLVQVTAGQQQASAGNIYLNTTQQSQIVEDQKPTIANTFRPNC